MTEAAEHYRQTGFWKGHPHYSCAEEGCPYDSTNPLVMESHWQRHHVPSPPVMVPTGLLDETGKPVLREWDPNTNDWK